MFLLSIKGGMSQWAELHIANRNGSVPVVINCIGGGKTCKNHLIVEDILIVTNDSRTVHVCVCVCVHSDNIIISFQCLHLH